MIPTVSSFYNTSVVYLVSVGQSLEENLFSVYEKVDKVGPLKTKI